MGGGLCLEVGCTWLLRCGWLASGYSLRCLVLDLLLDMARTLNDGHLEFSGGSGSVRINNSAYFLIGGYCDDLVPRCCYFGVIWLLPEMANHALVVESWQEIYVVIA